MSGRESITCRYCGLDEGEIVLDLGSQPASDHFPAAGSPPGADPAHPLRMWLCDGCGLAQLAEDPTSPEEPRGVEPEAMVRQARDAVARVAAAGLLPPTGTVREYGSPHGGSWLGLLAEAGLTEAPTDGPAQVVLDCIGIMHDADQAAGLRRRVEDVALGGVLLVEFHAFATIVGDGQWNALRHGHFAYYSVTALARMLDDVGFELTHGFWFELYGGTVLLAARRRGGTGPRDQASVAALLAADALVGVTDPVRVAALDRASARVASDVRGYLEQARAEGRRVLGYGAASRAVPLLCRAGIDVDLLPAIADASPAKQGRRMPGTSIPIVAPDDLAAREPDEVVLFVADLLEDVRDLLPAIERSGARWVVVDPDVRPVAPRVDVEEVPA